MQTDPGTLVDLDRYPVHDLLDQRTVALADECRVALHALYEWNGLLDFIAHVLEVPALYPRRGPRAQDDDGSDDAGDPGVLRRPS